MIILKLIRPWMFMFLRLSALALLFALVAGCGLVETTAQRATVAISSPQNGSQFQEGQDVVIQSVAADGKAVRIELQVDNKTVRVDPVAVGQFNLSQTWKATLGTHKLSVRVYDANNVASDFVEIAIVVSPVVELPNPPVVPPPGAPNAPNPLTPTLAPQAINPPIITPLPLAPSSSPTAASAPDIYVTAIRTDPLVPTTGIPIAFNVTFLNTTNGNRGITWRIAIFKVGGSANSLGDTPIMNNDVPLGTQEIKSGIWQSPKECLLLLANVFLVDSSNKQRLGSLLKTDRSGPFQFNFQTCS
ncbi:MAG: Ig-like domain-containing protein [Chloroflexi bacterium]|nr:Ig-like domain-containing protein [Chloroflexota bacterium]